MYGLVVIFKVKLTVFRCQYWRLIWVNTYPMINMIFAHFTYISTVEYAFLDILKQNRLWIYPTNIAMNLWYLIQPHYKTDIKYLWSTFTPGFAIDINKHVLFFLQGFDLNQIPKVAYRWLGHVNDSLYSLKYAHDSCVIILQVSYKYVLK